MSRPAAPNIDTRAGLAYALSAYLLWGFLPFFMKLLAHVPAGEVTAHRILWSVPVAGAVLLARGRMGDVALALRTPRMLGMAFVTAALISVNWATYVWAVTSDRVLDTALGYYINPLFSVFLGAVLLKERLNSTQKIAIALATCAVLVLTVEAGRVPVVALTLCVSFGFYAYFKKSLPIGPNQGFFLEVVILAPFALAYILWAEASGGGAFLQGSTGDRLLLLSSGLVTAVPLMLYANGAKGLRLSTIGILQYVAPTMILLSAVFAFGEPFGTARMVAFPLIWAALALYTASMLRRARPA